MKAHLTQYAGQQVLTGSQAQIFANDIIGVDTNMISGGKTYAQLSAASLADPSNTALEQPGRTSSFEGTPFAVSCSTRTPSVSLASSPSTRRLRRSYSRSSCSCSRLLGVRHYRQSDPADVI